jgi:hypothetical protein
LPIHASSPVLFGKSHCRHVDESDIEDFSTLIT